MFIFLYPFFIPLNMFKSGLTKHDWNRAHYTALHVTVKSLID